LAESSELKITVSALGGIVVITAVNGRFERFRTFSDAQGGPTSGPMREASFGGGGAVVDLIEREMAVTSAVVR
jgi:hypothetical protein